MKRIAIVYKHLRPEAQKLALVIKQWLESLNIEVSCQENIDTAGFCCAYEKMQIPEDADFVVVLGGDGTLLSVARTLEERKTPVIGINLGGLGFLTEISTETCFRDLKEILDGRYEIEERMRLQVSVMREGREIFGHRILNDMVINKGALARLLDIEASIDGRFLTRYRGDGLIVATPTGSTAYNLAAGGPIVYPAARAIIMTPICPFTLTNRAIVLPPEVTVQVKLAAPSPDVTLTGDGQVGCDLAPSDEIIIRLAQNPLRLLKPPSIEYFEILRTKLQWGQR